MRRFRAAENDLLKTVHRKQEFEALERLNRLEFEEQLKKYPSVPGHARHKIKHRSDTAGDLTIAVIRWLQLHGHKAWRQTSEGRYRPGEEITDVIGRVRQMKGQWLPGTNNGQSDVAAIVRGRFVAVEIKMNDAQSEAQKEYQFEIEASGGTYYIARNFTGFLNFYENF